MTWTIASEELSTFKYGHFGIFPLTPQPESTNNGAFDWSYQTPASIYAAAAAFEGAGDWKTF